MHRALPLLSAALIAVLCCTDARAAESYDSCTGTINTIPVVISTQGTWCLKADKATSLSSGILVSITTNNVTIDCNYFKLGGTGGGAATTAIGIQASGRSNITVRNCNVRGFSAGISVTGDGIVVEDNILDGSRSIGVSVIADGGVVRRNRIVDTGSGAGSPVAITVGQSTDVVDNLIDGVFGDTPYGIYNPDGAPVTGAIDDNRVRGLQGTTTAFGISVSVDARALMRGNHIVYGLPTTAPAGSMGIDCRMGPKNAPFANVAVGWPVGIGSCLAGSGNFSL